MDKSRQKSRGPGIPADLKWTSGDRRVEPVPESGCWLWTGRLCRKGYALDKVYPSNTPKRVHRLSYAKHVGPIPDGLVLDHTCRERSCVNPDHLRAVTPRQNTLENSLSLQAKWASRTECHICGAPLRKIVGRRYCPACDSARKKRRRGAR